MINTVKRFLIVQLIHFHADVCFMFGAILPPLFLEFMYVVAFQGHVPIIYISCHQASLKTMALDFSCVRASDPPCLFPIVYTKTVKFAARSLAKGEKIMIHHVTPSWWHKCDTPGLYISVEASEIYLVPSLALATIVCSQWLSFLLSTVFYIVGCNLEEYNWIWTINWLIVDWCTIKLLSTLSNHRDLRGFVFNCVLHVFQWCTHHYFNWVHWPCCWLSSTLSFPLSQHYKLLYRAFITLLLFLCFNAFLVSLVKCILLNLHEM